MAKIKVTLTVDTVKLFEGLRSIHGNSGPLGVRLASLLMTGEIGFDEEIALATYGVTHTKTTKLKE